MTPSPRIVSLLPSATEIAVGLGLRDHLVGRSHECDFPAGLESLPVLTGPKFTSDGSSSGINAEVSRLVKEGLSVYWVDSKKLDELAPDFILTQSQCEVCAVSMQDVEAAVCSLIGSRPQIINLEPLGYQNIFSDFLRAGETLGRTDAAARLVRSVQQGMDDIARLSSALPVKKRVATIEWLAPLMNAGNWIPTIIEKAGGINCLGKEGEHSHYISFDDLNNVNADVFLIMPCGFGIEQSLSELEQLRKEGEWKSFLQNNEVYVCDGNHFFNRPGPRILESTEIVAEILYPDIFTFGHEGSAWIRLKPGF